MKCQGCYRMEAEYRQVRMDGIYRELHEFMLCPDCVNYGSPFGELNKKGGAMPFKKKEEKKQEAKTGKYPSFRGVVTDADRNEIANITVWDTDPSDNPNFPVMTGNIEFSAGGEVSEGEKVRVALWKATRKKA